ncbi:response regulator [Halobacteriovorax sp. HLS]|uniref:response regulator n=1 Tax=Halobacteriovorax sp. HLS TaxID=2234000 RepID=UPI000FD84173|nr:response regulator [Halobacteriovorax sp. HLS]
MSKLGNLLLVDDEELILKKSKILLEDFADEIYTALNGTLALELLSSNEIHCIVCDINMPGLNGIDVIKEVRKRNIEIPFIFYTGHGSTELMKEAIKYGAFDFLDKPSLDGLEEVVQRGLAESLQVESVQNEDFVSEYKKMISSQK